MGHYDDPPETIEQREYRRKRVLLEEAMERILTKAVLSGCGDDDRDVAIAKDMAECLVGLIFANSGTKYKMVDSL